MGVSLPGKREYIYLCYYEYYVLFVVLYSVKAFRKDVTAKCVSKKM